MASRGKGLLVFMSVAKEDGQQLKALAISSPVGSGVMQENRLQNRRAPLCEKVVTNCRSRSPPFLFSGTDLVCNASRMVEQNVRIAILAVIAL